jgi:hypothetical protein
MLMNDAQKLDQCLTVQANKKNEEEIIGGNMLLRLLVNR